MDVLQAANQDEVRHDKDTFQLMTMYNQEVSDRMKQMPKYIQFQ